MTLLVQPVGAMLLASWFFGEAMGPVQGLGAAVVVAGILLARAGSRPRETAAVVPHPGAPK